MNKFNLMVFNTKKGVLKKLLNNMEAYLSGLLLKQEYKVCGTYGCIALTSLWSFEGLKSWKVYPLKRTLTDGNLNQL